MPASLLLGHQEKQLLRDMASPVSTSTGAHCKAPKYGGSIAASWMDEQPSFRPRDEWHSIERRGAGQMLLGFAGPMNAFFFEIDKVIHSLIPLAFRGIWLGASCFWSFGLRHSKLRLMRDENLVSTIIPVHNRAKMLREAVSRCSPKGIGPSKLL